MSTHAARSLETKLLLPSQAHSLLNQALLLSHIAVTRYERAGFF